MEDTNETIDPGEEDLPSDGAVATEEPVVHGALLRNMMTVVLLLGLPLFGIVAVWTVSTWNRKARIIVTALFAIPAIYYPYIMFSALFRAAF